MRIFAQKPNATQQTMSVKSTHPSRVPCEQSRGVYYNFHLRRTIGNHVVPRLPESKAYEHSDEATSTAPQRFSHDFSQIPLTSEFCTNHLPYSERIQAHIGKHDLGQVQVRAGGAAAETANELNAMASTSTERIAFKNSSNLRLAAHEAAHIVKQRTGAWPQRGVRRPNTALERHADAVAKNDVENRGAESLLDAIPTTSNGRLPNGFAIQLKRSRDTYPWVGEIVGAWSVAMRETPHKNPTHPHHNTKADLPRGSEVMVTGRRGGWLHISVRFDGVEKSGYVSQELVRFVRASAFQGDPIEIKVKIPSLSEALMILKRAEIQKAKAGATYKLSEDEKRKIGLSISVVERTGKYTVNYATYQVGFVEAAGKKVEVTTIQDFILFVEQVERQYPSAAPSEIASEIRQLWFSDTNWEILVASQGVKKGGKHVDIETPPNPIAKRFNMKTLAPDALGKKIATPLGTVNIGHVMSGIDAALSGFPAAYPKAHLTSRGNDDDEARLKHKTLKAASGGNTLDFSTWAGDLGQAYAEYFVEKYVSKKSASLAGFMKKKSPPAELLGDIHGYIAVQVWREIPTSASPTGSAFKISNVLRELYLNRNKKIPPMKDTAKVDKKKTYLDYIEQLSGMSGPKLKPFVRNRALAFARPWFAKKAKDATKAKAVIWDSGRKTWFGAFSKEAALNEWMKEFDRLHADHEKKAKANDKLGKAVDDFIATLGGTVE